MFGKLFYQVQVYLFGHRPLAMEDHYPTMADVVRPLARGGSVTADDAR